MLPTIVKKPLEVYNSDRWVSVDLETTNLDKGDPLNKDNRIVYGYIRTKNKEFEIYNEYELSNLSDLFENTPFIIAQNAKFELGWLKRCGIKLEKVTVFDTMIAEYKLLGNRKKPLDLDSIAERYNLPLKGRLVSGLIESGICPSEIPLSFLRAYCKQDVIITELVFQIQLELLKASGLLNTFYTACLLTPCLTDIEANGVYLDEDRVLKEYYVCQEQYDKLKREFDDFTGGINSDSPKQVGEYIYGKLGFSELTDRRGNPVRTATGKPSTGKEVIAGLTPRNKQQRRFLELYQELQRAETDLTAYLKKFKQCCEDDRGVLFAKFNQTVTRTHRLSSSGKKYKIQFQNFARKFKPLFKARKKSWKIFEADGSQLEFRTAAILGNDEVAINDINNKVDVHTVTASILSNNGQQTDRQDAKEHTFKPLYGGSSGTDAEQAYYSAFKDKYKGIAKTQQKWIDEVLATKKLVTLTGLIYYWPDTKATRSGYVTNTTSICNYPVQFLATGEIIPISVICLWHEMKLREVESFICNTIHDSVILELNPEESGLIGELAHVAFTEQVYEYMKFIYNIELLPILAEEQKISDNWGA